MVFIWQHPVQLEHADRRRWCLVRLVEQFGRDAFGRDDREPGDQSSYDLSSLNDGVWHFLISSETNGIWSPVVVKQFGLDRKPPDPFTITRTDSDPADTQLTFTWTTTDSLSGLSHYEAKIGSGDWFDPEGLRQGSSYVIPESAPGKRSLAVRAIDNAGNIGKKTRPSRSLCSIAGRNGGIRWSASSHSHSWFLRSSSPRSSFSSTFFPEASMRGNERRSVSCMSSRYLSLKRSEKWTAGKKREGKIIRYRSSARNPCERKKGKRGRGAPPQGGNQNGNREDRKIDGREIEAREVR